MNSKILSIDGWMDEIELQWLYDTVQKIPKGGIFIEIGAWKGRSSGALYEGAGSNKAVISIDTWKGQPDLVDGAHKEAVTSDLFAVYLENMRALGFDPKPYHRGALGPQYIISDSIQAAALFDDGSVHIVFIDGDHLITGQDIDAYLPKVRTDGLLTGHDYFCFYEEIQQEIHKRFYIHQLIHSIWVRHVGLHKPGWYT